MPTKSSLYPVCPHCSYLFSENQLRMYHAGFSNLGFLYCDACPNIFTFSSFNEQYINLVGHFHPWVLSKKQKRKVEAHIAPCKCSGHFKFGGFPKCPSCLRDISKIVEGGIYYVKIGDEIDGDKEIGHWLVGKTAKN